MHVLARLARTITQADWVKEVKRVSNLWMKEQGLEYVGFQWQGGYACFSVSQSNLLQVEEYIDRQEEHHCIITFQDELSGLLHKHHIEFDERFVWD